MVCECPVCVCVKVGMDSTILRGVGGGGCTGIYVTSVCVCVCVCMCVCACVEMKVISTIHVTM